MGEPTDADLLALFRQEGQRHHAFNLLVRRYQRRLYGFIRRMVTAHEDAEDVLQNTFLKAWAGLDGFRQESQLFSWLYRIAHNECLNHLRRLRNKSFVSDQAVIDRLTTTLDSSELFSGDAIQRSLQRAVMRLPDKQRAVFIMRYFDGLKYEDMSAATGTSVGALKSSYHIAVKKIEQWLTVDQTQPAPEASQQPASDAYHT
jgi:RNA polymerase sigma-70 factor (ECF subfamily)